MKTIDIEMQKSNYLNFVDSRKMLLLHMLDNDGHPFSSCAPFVLHNGKFYVYISEVADHFHLLAKTEWVDTMIIADQSETKNPFATERARWRCSVKNIGNEDHEDIFSLFDKRFNSSLMVVLRGLDFSLFELTPSLGRYVVGFGLAFDVDVEGNIFSHVVVDKSKK